jgi:O-Antigen ligase.
VGVNNSKLNNQVVVYLQGPGAVRIKLLYLVSLFLVFALGVNSKFTGVNNVEVFQKVFILAVSLIIFFLSGFNRLLIWNYVFFILIVFLTFFLSTIGVVDILFVIYSLASMSIFYVNLSLNNAFYIKQVVLALKVLPISMLAFSFLLSLFSSYPLYIVEYTGAFRLASGIDPALYAFLIFYSIVIVVFDSIKTNRVEIRLLTLLFVLLLLTGSRGPLLASLIVTLSLVPLRKNPEIRSFIKIGAIPVFIVFVYLLGNMMLRSMLEDEPGFNLSGRNFAWEFMISSFDSINLFGRGLGSVTLATVGIGGNNLSAFIAPHNEYVRFWYDLGWIGSCLFFVNILIILYLCVFKLSGRFAFFRVLFCIGILFFCFFDNVFSTHHSAFPLAVFLKYAYDSRLNKGNGCE